MTSMSRSVIFAKIIRSVAAVAALTLSVAACLASAAAAAASPQDALARVRTATVQVKVEYAAPFENDGSWGTGFIVGNGLVMTNAHIVSDKVPARVLIFNEFLPATEAQIVAYRYDTSELDKGDILEYIANTIIKRGRLTGVQLAKPFTSYDVALLSFTPTAASSRLPVLAFASQAVPNEGVYAVGYPGLDQPAEYRAQQYSTASSNHTPLSITAGRVRQVISGAPRLVMHDALSKFGNSGGPLVNTRGEVVGMQTWSAEPDSQGTVISFALSGNDLSAFLAARGNIASLLSGQNNARDWVLQSAQAGDSDYIALAGLLSFMGDAGFAHDHALAVKYLQQAINYNPGSPNAYLYQAGLAAILARSPDVQAQQQAMQILRQVNNSDQVGPNSRHPDNRLLAYESALYMQGTAPGIPLDFNRSFQLSEKSMEQGAFAIPLAISGFHYYFGDAYAGRNHTEALDMAREAARNGIPEGISLLAHLYYDSDVLQKNQANQQTARRFAQIAAEQNDPWALGLLATIYYDSGDARERAQAYELAQRGAQSGNRLAYYCLGRFAWDAYLRNPADPSLAAKAWALVDTAERQGVRVAFRSAGNPGQTITSSRDILASFPPNAQQQLLADGKREQQRIHGGI